MVQTLQMFPAGCYLVIFSDSKSFKLSFLFCFSKRFFLSPLTLDFTELYSWPKKDLYSLLLTFLSILKDTKDKVNTYALSYILITHSFYACRGVRISNQ